MSIITTDIETAHEIFAKLMQYRKLDCNDPLYTAYLNSGITQEAVNSLERSFNVQILRSNEAMYLVPEDDNTFLGFNMTDLKAELKLTGTNDDDEPDYYLSLFVVIVLIYAFYDGHGIDPKSREQLRFGEFLDMITECLKEGMSRNNEDEDDTYVLPFTSLYKKYERLTPLGEIPSRKGRLSNRHTKEGFVSSIIAFLASPKQNLVVFSKDDEIIKTTARMDCIVRNKLLNNADYQRVKNIFNATTTTGE